MRGLLNYNKCAFLSDNLFGFPDLISIPNKIDLCSYIDFDTFRRMRKYKRVNSSVHFYCDDYKFDCIWNYPDKYIGMFSDCNHIIMPDFSLYYDFPVALQIFNKYRNHWLSEFYSVHGIKVIPNINLSSPSCWDWSFLGYPSRSVVAFCSIGSSKDFICKDILFKMYDEMIKRLEPIQILFFTRSKNIAPSECDIIEIPFFKGGVFNG